MADTKLYDYLKDMFILSYIDTKDVEDNYISWSCKDGTSIVVKAVESKGENSSEMSPMIITKELLDEFEVDKKTLYTDALNNTENNYIYPNCPPNEINFTDYEEWVTTLEKTCNLLGSVTFKIFMSYGMNGRTEEEQEKARSRLTKRIRRKLADSYAEDTNVILISNHKCIGSEKDGRLYYLGEAIKKMDKCDAIIFDDDWKEHKGCQIERQVAATYGLKIIE